MPTAFCPYVSPSVCLSLCVPSSDSSFLIWWQGGKKKNLKKKKSSLKSNDGEGAADLLNPSEISLFQQAGRQTGGQSWSCCTVSSGSVLPPGSTGASHSLDRSPGKKKRQSEKGEECGGASCLACSLSVLEKKVKLQLLSQLTLEESGRVQTSVSERDCSHTATDLDKGFMPWSWFGKACVRVLWVIYRLS